MKRILAITLALALALCAMSISAFAVSYDFEDGVIPAEWEQHWGGKNFTIVDGTLFVERLVDQNSYYSAGFLAGSFTGGVTYTVKADIWFDDAEYGDTNLYIALVDSNFDGTVYASAEQTLASGEVAHLIFTFTPDADVENVWFTSKQNVWNGQGVDYYIDNVSIAEGAEEIPVETPVEEPAEEAPVETPAEEAPAEEVEAPAESADTGLVLAVVPMIVAAVAVVASKRR